MAFKLRTGSGTLSAAAATTTAVYVDQGQAFFASASPTGWTSGDIALQVSRDNSVWHLTGRLLTKGTQEMIDAVSNAPAYMRLIAASNFVGTSVAASVTTHERKPS